MSNKKVPASKKSVNSRELIRRGTQDVFSRGENASEKAVVSASTLRALQLRNGKGGSFGTGEVMRITGREKLELLAGRTITSHTPYLTP